MSKADHEKPKSKKAANPDPEHTDASVTHREEAAPVQPKSDDPPEETKAGATALGDDPGTTPHPAHDYQQAITKMDFGSKKRNR